MRSEDRTLLSLKLFPAHLYWHLYASLRQDFCKVLRRLIQLASDKTICKISSDLDLSPLPTYLTEQLPARLNTPSAFLPFSIHCKRSALALRFQFAAIHLEAQQRTFATTFRWYKAPVRSTPFLCAEDIITESASLCQVPLSSFLIGITHATPKAYC